MRRPVDLHTPMVEVHGKRRKVFGAAEEAVDPPTRIPLPLRTAATVQATVGVKVIDEVAEDRPRKRGEGRAAVDDSSPKGGHTRCDDNAADHECTGEDKVVVLRRQAQPLDAPAGIFLATAATDVVRGLIAAHSEFASPSGKAEGEDRGIDVLLVLEQVLQDRGPALAVAALAGGGQAHDAVGPLLVEEPVLPAVAAEARPHGGVLLRALAEPDKVIEPEAGDGAALGVQLLVGALAADAIAGAMLAAVQPSRGRRA
mmetsp:Transcript_57964/g.186157  ORF Transcript_57964/g.186157 Transcript_57964/m.186157 type:complete len:257 (-) Transcript_57964:384-1154(-)